MKFLFALLALVAIASANPWGAPWNVVPQPVQDLPDVAAARAVHLAEVARQTLAALQGRPWAVPVAAPIVITAARVSRNSSPAEVAAARAAYLSEVARITGERVGALNAALARAGQAPIAAPALVGAPQPIQDNPDVALARATHLAEVARQNNAALAALVRVGAPDPLRALRGKGLLG